MPNYKSFAKFYDATIGDRGKVVDFLRGLMRAQRIEGKKVLELACGTGAILRLLPEGQLYGVDLSGEMLEIARAKVPSAKFFQQDMVKFEFDEKFDVVLCLFDSINHLLSFSEWEKLFLNVRQHLNDGGVFIFDINTQWKLERSASEAIWVKKIGENLLLMKVIDDKDGIFTFNVKVFEKIGGTNFRLHEENIKETTFPILQIKKSLSRLFNSVKIVDPDRKRLSSKSTRVYFVCEFKK